MTKQTCDMSLSNASTSALLTQMAAAALLQGEAETQVRRLESETRVRGNNARRAAALVEWQDRACKWRGMAIACRREIDRRLESVAKLVGNLTDCD